MDQRQEEKQSSSSSLHELHAEAATGMEAQLSQDAGRQLDRFCRQYLQLLREPDYPQDEHLRAELFQQSLFARLFEENAVAHPPPLRYQLRVLKELITRIEQATTGSEDEVCFAPGAILEV